MPKQDVPFDFESDEERSKWCATDSAENELARHFEGSGRGYNKAERLRIIETRIRRSIDPATGQPNFPRS